MRIRGIRGTGLAVLVGAAAFLAGPAVAQEPLALDPERLDEITAGGRIKLPLPPRDPAVLPPLRLDGIAVLPVPSEPKPAPPPTTGATGNGKRSVSRSGKKTFKADRVNKRHRETLIVSGSAGG